MLILPILLTHFSWNPRHTPFVQLVNEMVDTDVEILRRGLNVADLPADTSSILGLSS